MTPAQMFIQDSGIMYKIERNGSVIAELKGLQNFNKNLSRRYVGFMPGSDVQSGDWIISPANERFFVVDRITSFAFGEESELQAYFQTAVEKKSETESATNIFNIGNVTNSIVGTQSGFTMNINSPFQEAREQIDSSDSDDKEELHQIIDLLENALNNQTPVKKGLLSKFSAAMQRNSWITGTISSLLLKWLTSKTL